MNANVTDALDRNALIAELARIIAAVAQGADDDARFMISGLAKSLGDARQQTLPGLPAPPPALTAEMIHKSACGRLFAYWQQRCSHPAAKMTPERASCIIARLRAGYTESEIRKAIDGAAVSAYVDPASGKKFDDLTLICRNGSKLEDFIERGVRATGDIVAEVTAATPVDEKIADLRRRMSDMKKAGRDTEYQQAANELAELMNQRKARK